MEPTLYNSLQQVLAAVIINLILQVCVNNWKGFNQEEDLKEVWTLNFEIQIGKNVPVKLRIGKIN